MDNPLDHDEFTSQLVAVQRRLYAYILTILPNLADADDVLQDTNSVLLRKRKEYAAGTEFGAWACRVAYFEVLALRKKRQRERGRLFVRRSKPAGQPRPGGRRPFHNRRSKAVGAVGTLHGEA